MRHKSSPSTRYSSRSTVAHDVADARSSASPSLARSMASATSEHPLTPTSAPGPEPGRPPHHCEIQTPRGPSPHRRFPRRLRQITVLVSSGSVLRTYESEHLAFPAPPNPTRRYRMPALPTHAAFQPPTTLELDRTWSLGGQIGSGGFARVYVVTSPDIPPHVAKFVPKDPGAARELRIPDLTNSLPNVVPVVDRGQWNNHWILIMPMAQSSLADLISGNPGPVAASHVEMILADLAQALVAIKDHIVHRDIKPSNILLLNGKWCLADFGIARYAEHTTATQTWKHARSAPYAAPEQWQDKRTTPATDVYSLGVVAYHLLAGEPPFGGPKIHDYRQQHLVQQPPRLKGAPTHLATTIDECLAKPPESRPTAKQVLSRLKQGARPQSEAARRLAEANHRFVRKRGESETRRAAAELEKEHMELLVVAATGSLIRIVGVP